MSGKFGNKTMAKFLYNNSLFNVYVIGGNRRVMINSVELGKRMLQGMLPRRKMFLVLDDVNKLNQLDALCISRRFVKEV
nr:hypothetical protein MtrDRAFT_AC183371g4v1 [Medicago truncatula]